MDGTPWFAAEANHGLSLQVRQNAFRRTKSPTPTAGPNMDASTSTRNDLPAITQPRTQLSASADKMSSTSSPTSRTKLDPSERPRPVALLDHKQFILEKLSWIGLFSIPSQCDLAWANVMMRRTIFTSLGPMPLF